MGRITNGDADASVYLGLEVQGVDPGQPDNGPGRRAPRRRLLALRKVVSDRGEAGSHCGG